MKNMNGIPLDTIKDRCRESMLSRPADVEEPRFIFIGGSARTGTTLLQNILCADKTVNPLLPEAAPVRLLLKALQQISRHTQKCGPEKMIPERKSNEKYTDG